MSTAVAISTTGDEHRIGFLETAVRMWDMALNPGDSLFVTVDGTPKEAAFVAEAVDHITGSVYRVGAKVGTYPAYRLGVAANKNTGLELMMDQTRADHLFLCDDDTYPLSSNVLRAHKNNPYLPHSMVCWGKHRLLGRHNGYAEWSWPRGVMLYQHRKVVDQVGGMVEAFGIGGHEHAEYSRRIHQHGLTPAPYVTPLVYGAEGTLGPAMRAAHHWHAEDMRQPYESSVELGQRRKQITSIKRIEGWEKAEKLMESQDGNTAYVPFRAHENGRASATLCTAPLPPGGEQ